MKYGKVPKVLLKFKMCLFRLDCLVFILKSSKGKKRFEFLSETKQRIEINKDEKKGIIHSLGLERIIRHGQKERIWTLRRLYLNLIYTVN